MISLYDAEIEGFDTEMKVERIDYDMGVQIGLGIKDKAGEFIHRDCVRLSKPGAKQLRIFLQALE